MNRDIAIIGVGGRFPDAVTIQQFYQNLRDGRDSVRKMPAHMISERTIPNDLEYTAMGYLENIDKFDHKFFNISITEAQCMDPVQRMLLEVTYEMIENAGYNPDFFYNSRTTIYLSHADYNYFHFLMDKIKHEPTLFTGNNHFAAAGRIARYFNLRGNATVVNNGCSSALNAVHLACNELIYGEADYAIAMGARISIFSAEKNPAVFDIGIEAFDGKTRSFSDDSNGSGEGEMIGCILLKPLEKAMADNDHIYAVIKSTVANQSGMLASSLTATNGAAQAEMLREAWKKANIDPITITQLEAHGSGTKLGDPIEIAGVDLAYEGTTDKKHFVAVSSVKTNIGHADTGAGMAGLIKAALSVKHKELFPSLHFNVPNPFIDFKKSVTYINTELKNWQPECGVLRVGVNSLGFTGNNVHVLLENPVERILEKDTTAKYYLVTISAKSPDGLKRNIKALIDHLAVPGEDLLRDISFTLTVGRKHYDYRCAVIAESKGDLLNLLNKEYDKTANKERKEPFRKSVFVFSDDCNINESLIKSLSEAYPSFKNNYEKCLAVQPETSENVKRFSFQYATYQLLTASGLSSKQLVGLGAGKQVIAAIMGKASLEEAITTASLISSEEHNDLPKRLQSLIEKETEKDNILFIEIGPESRISKNLRTLNSSYRDIYEVLCLESDSKNPLLDLIKECYLLNYSNIDWNKYAEINKGYRIVLPTYQFEKIRCWATEPSSIPEVQQKNKFKTAIGKPATDEEPFTDATFPGEWSETEKKVAHIWSSVLKAKDLKLTDDFFALGGHSLFLIQVNNRIEKEFNFKFQLKEMFAFATIRSLAQAIDMILKEGRPVLRHTAIMPIKKRKYYPVSFAQKRLWILSQFVESSLAYNLPDAYTFEGALNKKALKKSFDTLIERHESLRTIFVTVDGEPVQKIISAKKIGFKIKDIKLTGTDKEIKAREIANQEAITPFDLATGPLLRVTIIEIEKSRHIVLFTLHHIIADGWSATIIINEILTLYNAYQRGEPNPLNPLRIQYKDYAAWQEQKLNGDELKLHKDYWLNRFSGNIPTLKLPSDKVRPAVQTFNGDAISFTIDKKLTGKIEKLNKTLGATMFMTLLASLKTILYKYSGQTDMIIGSPSAGRDDTDLENQIGFYINTLALRTSFTPETTFSQLLLQVKEVTLGAHQNQIYPLDRLIEELNLERDMSRSALFDIIMILHNTVVESGHGQHDLTEIKITPFAKEHKVSQRDLTLNFQEINGEIEGGIEYNTDVFSKQWIEILINQYKNLLNQITENPEQQLKSYNIAIDEIKEQSSAVHEKEKSIEDKPAIEKRQGIYIAPRNETESRVVEIIGQLLASKNPVSITDNFFEIGGHSLKAMRLIYRINKELDTKIGLATIYAHPTIEKLAEVIAEGKTGNATRKETNGRLPGSEDAKILPLKKQEYYDVTYAQLNFLNQNQIPEDNIPGRLPLGAIDEEALIKTWKSLIERHESFRTVFLKVNGEWKQKILPAGNPIFELEVIDLRREIRKDEIASKIEEEIINKPYDFINGPLISGKLLRLSDEEYDLVFTISHAISDGWTLNILKRDMDVLYEAFVNKKPNPLPPLPIQVKEYAAWHNKLLSHKNSVQLKKYWHNKLKGKLPKLNLPVDYPDGFADIGRYAIYRIYLDADFQRQLNDFTLKSGTSLFALMLASLNVLLYKLTGQKDIIVTTPVATREHEELNDVVGFFVNSLLIRSGINEKMPFAEFMAETSRDFVEAMSNQAYPVEKVFDELNFSTSDYTPVLLNTHNYPGQTLPTLTNTESRHDASDLRSRVYIGLVFDEYKNGIEINWLYRVNLFKPGTIEQISSSFMHLIEKVLEEPDIEIREINTVLEELI